MLIRPRDLAALAAANPALDAWAIERRRALHRRPELSGQERETQAYLQAELEALGIERLPCGAGRAVAGLIRGALPGPTVALRADMDALPVEEPEGTPFRSERPGVMHACGHDAHMAALLGAARLLMAHTERMPGSVKLLFEPAEETSGGAREMIAAGCMANPTVNAVVGLHVSPALPAGHMSVRPGVAHGSSDAVALTLRGRAGHAAYPEQGVDAIAIAAQVITALQTLVSRETSPLDSAVLSLGVIEGGTTSNILCDRVTVRGTLRTLLPETRDRLRRRVAEVTEGVARALGGEGEATLTEGYGPVINDPALTGRALELGRAMLGADRVRAAERPSLGVESFSFFAREARGLFWNIGCGLGPPLHAREFAVDEACIPAAARVQAALAWELLLLLSTKELSTKE
ncbi:MAG: M20 family metallopeptidase [Clostridia bacterium]|nr:M20 family metallopeptidase [Clostridia bacterium]